MRGADHPTSKSQSPRAKAPPARDFTRACHDGPDAIVRHTAVFFAFAAALSLTNCKGFVREMWERAMRAGIVAGCVALALLVAGCNSLDSRYQRYGIGTDLYWDGLPARLNSKTPTLHTFAAQAISSTARSADAAICDGLTLGSRDWGLLVQAGMNDIDLRCDGYLAWLHDKRASREPILKQLAALGGATAAILRATDVGATPIALAGIAFGLAAETFTNIDLRLLNGVDYTTVQSVVRDNRTQFRTNNLNLVIDNRPAAIYVLRNYLSICMPSSIEMSINNTINVYHRGGPEALRNTPVGLRAAPATSGTSAAVRGTPVRATERISEPVRAPIERHPEFAEILDPTTPRRTASASFRRCKGRCVCPETRLGAGPTTKALIAIFEASPHTKTNNNGRLDAKEIAQIRGQGPCVAGGGRNFSRKLTYPSMTRRQRGVDAVDCGPRQVAWPQLTYDADAR